MSSIIKVIIAVSILLIQGCTSTSIVLTDKANSMYLDNEFQYELSEQDIYDELFSVSPEMQA